MYIMFPIGIMYYFGTNLDSRFSVPDFWPKPGQTHTIPFEREEIKEELERLKQRRLEARARRLELERREQEADIKASGEPQQMDRLREGGGVEGTKMVGEMTSQGGEGKGWFGWLKS